MYIAMNRFKVQNGSEAAFEESGRTVIQALRR